MPRRVPRRRCPVMHRPPPRLRWSATTFRPSAIAPSTGTRWTCRSLPRCCATAQPHTWTIPSPTATSGSTARTGPSPLRASWNTSASPREQSMTIILNGVPTTVSLPADVRINGRRGTPDEHVRNGDDIEARLDGRPPLYINFCLTPESRWTVWPTDASSSSCAASKPASPHLYPTATTSSSATSNKRTRSVRVKFA